MNPYSESIKIVFDRIRESDRSTIDSSISLAMQAIKKVDDGKFLSGIEQLFFVDNIESWLEENNHKNFLSSGITLPDDEEKRLAILTQIFIYINKSQKGIGSITYYTHSFLSDGMALFLNIAAVAGGFRGNQKGLTENVTRQQEQDEEDARWFVNKISNEYERLLLSRISYQYNNMRHNITISNIENSTIIVHSHLQNVLNKYTNDEEIKTALQKLGDLIAKSENKDAADAYNDMNEELSKEAPSGSKLKAYWNMIKTHLPEIKNTIEITAAITKLFA